MNYTGKYECKQLHVWKSRKTQLNIFARYEVTKRKLKGNKNINILFNVDFLNENNID